MIAAEELQVAPFSTTLSRVEEMDNPRVLAQREGSLGRPREIALKQGDGADTRHKCRCGEKIVSPPASGR
jgi:hypothetical protein